MLEYIDTTLSILSQPFMLRAIYGGLIVAIVTAIVGVFITLKKESFIADAIAHGSLAGIALAILLSTQPLLFAMITAVVMALAITYFKLESSVSADSIIGIVFPFLFAIGILLLSFQGSYRPELTTFLFGNLLAITTVDVFIALLAMFTVCILVFSNYKSLVYATFDPEAAEVSGIKVKRLEYIYAVVVAISIVISVKLAGIILLTAMFVIPATTAKMLAQNFKQMIPIALIHNLLTLIIGLFLSTYLPIGPVLVMVSVSLFLIVFALKQISS
jgi:zinc transport system permease protein